MSAVGSLRAGLLLAFALVGRRSRPAGRRHVRWSTRSSAGDHDAVRALLARADRRQPARAGRHDGAALGGARRTTPRRSTLLLRAGAKASAANRYGVKPLTLAAINGDAGIIEQLLKAGADPNTATAEGETALVDRRADRQRRRR